MKNILLTIFLSLGVLNVFSQKYVPVPAKIEAENYSSMSGVKTETTADAGAGSDVAYIDNNDWMNYNINVAAAGTYAFSFRVANPSSNGKIEIRNAGGVALNSVAIPVTGGWQAWKTVTVNATLPAGNQTLKLYIVSGGFNLNWFQIATPAPVTYVAAPAKIEAENYAAMSGVVTEATADAGGGMELGYIDNNDWMDYNINVATAGTYTFSFRVANPSSNSSIEIRNANGTALKAVTVPITGAWQIWTTVTVSATLPAGNQTIRLFVVSGGFNLNFFQIATPSPVTYLPVPAKIEAENYSAMSGVVTEATADAGGGMELGYIDTYDWMDYNVNVAVAGTYTFNFRVANPSSNGKIEIRNASGVALNSVAIPVTGDWQIWTIATVNVTLPAGNQTIRLYAATGAFNFNWFQIAAYTPVTTTPTTSITTPTTTPTTTTTSTPTTTSSVSKIPMNGKNWYEINSTGDGVGPTQGLKELNDGILTAAPFDGWGKMFNQYNCWYDFKKLKNVVISRIRMYNGGKASPGQPFTLYARKSFKDSTFLASYDGSQPANTWIDITLPTPVSANYLMANVYWNFPNEVEIYGTYTTDSSATLAAKKDIRFRDQLGVNQAIWDLTQGNTNINIRDTIDPVRLKLAKSFTQVRDYVEWDKIETTQGKFIFQVTQSGAWNYDKMYKGLKANNMEVLPCLKNIPSWFSNLYYPATLADAENVPAPYGSDLLNPNSYILQAKFAFQFVARYGSTAVDKSLLSGVVTGAVYPGDPNTVIRTVETGMNLIKYIECENERDKWWKGRKAYQTGFEYAANLSAFYDGNKNTMGPGVGVKNADPNIKVVIGGTASTSTDYVRAIIDWCRENRGYKADGSINLCFDVMNYHIYANNAGSSQGAQSTRGAAPEVSGSANVANDFNQLAREYNLEAWITETGYDLNQGSTIHTPAIGTKTPTQVEADWMVRTALLNARNNITKNFFYQMYDYAPTSTLMFASSGLLNDGQFNSGVFSRKLAADYIMQTQNLIGNYFYKETISSDPTVDRYQLNDTSIYALAIPDEVGRTASYILKTGTSDSAKIYTFVAGSDVMQMKTVKLLNGQITLTVTETPIFVKLVGQAATQSTARTIAADTTTNRLALNENQVKIQNTNMVAEIKMFPNPTTDILNVQLKNEKQENVEMRIVEAASGRTFKSFSLNDRSTYISKQIDVKSLPAGMFVLQIVKGEETITKKFLKF